MTENNDGGEGGVPLTTITAMEARIKEQQAQIDAYRSAEQREIRRQNRSSSLGDAIMEVIETTGVTLHAQWIARARELAGDEAWLWNTPALADDGIEVIEREDGRIQIRPVRAPSA